jgi:hypothetical protein
MLLLLLLLRSRPPSCCCCWGLPACIRLTHAPHAHLHDPEGLQAGLLEWWGLQRWGQELAVVCQEAGCTGTSNHRVGDVWGGMWWPCYLRFWAEALLACSTPRTSNRSEGDRRLVFKLRDLPSQLH